jgi:hypothetical protein
LAQKYVEHLKILEIKKTELIETESEWTLQVPKSLQFLPIP